MQSRGPNYTTILMVILVLALGFILYQVLGGAYLDPLHFHLPRFTSFEGILSGITNSMHAMSNSMSSMFKSFWR